MKLLKRLISAKDSSGSIHLRPTEPEDLWHTYNLLQTPTDTLRSTTLRKVTQTSSTGSTKSSKVRTNLTIAVHKVDFDPDALTLRASGPNVAESKFVKMGAYHTITIELGRNFWLEKECWDRIYLDRIDRAVHPERGAEIAAVVMQSGLAHVCLVTGELTVVKAKIETSIPKKRTGCSRHEKAVGKFYEAVYQAVLRDVDFDVVKCVVCASPGYVKDDFFRYMMQQAERRDGKSRSSGNSGGNSAAAGGNDDRVLLQNKNKFVLCKASSGHKHALEEVFMDECIVERMTETKFSKEVEILNRFMRMIDTDPERAYYGYQHVSSANSELAIESLLVTDELFRSSDVPTRKKYVQLVESVRENGGKVYIFSSLHVSGSQLQQVSGVAAILRYPLPDLEQLELDAAALDEEDSSDSDSDFGGNGGGDDDGDGDDDDDVKFKSNELDRAQEDLEGMGF